MQLGGHRSDRDRRNNDEQCDMATDPRSHSAIRSRAYADLEIDRRIAVHSGSARLCLGPLYYGGILAGSLEDAEDVTGRSEARIYDTPHPPTHHKQTNSTPTNTPTNAFL